MTRITMKFGGTSVGDADAIEQVIRILTQSQAGGNQVLAIVSAMAGTTDALIESIDAAISGNKWGYLSLSRNIRDKHEEANTLLLPAGKARDELNSTINSILDEHIQLCDAINILREATPRIYDAIVSIGERLSSRIIAAALSQRGVNAMQIDAHQYIVTDDQYQNAEPIWDATRENIQSNLVPEIEAGVLPIITGFMGATVNGDITTLGRGGSDFSAAIFAACSDSDELIIWTDVDGVLTTDPRIDNRAKVIPHISYQEVGELAYYGAKVLHPKTVQPIIDQGIPLYVRNTFNPQNIGTLISAEMQASEGIIKAVTGVRNISLMTVKGRGMLGVPGIAGRTFLATAAADASILIISQSSSEQSICFAVINDKAQAAKEAIEVELAQEIARHDVDSVDVLENVVIITTVGAGMRGTPGIAGRVFTTLGEKALNVLAIAQGSSECSISCVLHESDLVPAVTALHELALVNGVHQVQN